MYEHILIPVDRTKGTTKCIHEGIDLAKRLGATVHGLYITDSRDYSAHHESKWPTTIVESTDDSKVALSAIEKPASEVGIEVVSSAQRGVPAEVILDYVGENDIDLIVLGTYERTGLGRVLLGSLPEKLIRKSPVPVHIVPINRRDH